MAITASGIFGNSKNSPDAGVGGTGNTAEAALVPGTYFSYQVSPNFWLGMSVNAPFGLSVTFPAVWAGAQYAAGDSHLRTYNATPSIAWQINNWISVGAGVQIQYADAGVTSSPVPGAIVSHLEGDGWGFGFTAGVTLTPTPTTTIGLGYRSFIDQKIEGSVTVSPIPPGFASSAETKVRLPDMVSLGIRQRLDPQWTLLGTVEWSNWSRIGTSNISGPPGGASIAFDYDDGWFFAVGAEYQWTPAVTTRAGIAYEISPVSDAVRTPLIPDNDRIWLSLGLSAHLTPNLKLDFGYSHIFVQDARINIPAGPFPLAGYAGSVDLHVDIVTIGLSYSWGAHEPVRKTALITK